MTENLHVNTWAHENLIWKSLSLSGNRLGKTSSMMCCNESGVYHYKSIYLLLKIKITRQVTNLWVNDNTAVLQYTRVSWHGDMEDKSNNEP